MKIEILQNKSGVYYWRIVAANGYILAHSETYSSRSKAAQTAWRVWTEFTGGNVKVVEVVK